MNSFKICDSQDFYSRNGSDSVINWNQCPKEDSEDIEYILLVTFIHKKGRFHLKCMEGFFIFILKKFF